MDRIIGNFLLLLSWKLIRCIPLTICYHLYFLRISKIWNILHHRSVGEFRVKNATLFTCTLLIFVVVVLLFFPNTFPFMSHVLINYNKIWTSSSWVHRALKIVEHLQAGAVRATMLDSFATWFIHLTLSIWLNQPCFFDEACLSRKKFLKIIRLWWFFVYWFWLA